MQALQSHASTFLMVSWDCSTANSGVMKKHFLKLVLFFGLVLSPMCLSAQAEKAVVKAGTVVELQSVKTVYARDVEIGDVVKFKVVADVKSGDDVLIPVGTIADGVVAEAAKSSLAGTKGRLSINLKSLTLADGTKIALDGSVRVVGKNRTPLAVITACFVLPCIFIPGTKAVLTEGYNATATVVANTEIMIGQ